ncbi:MAG: hypothetical protein ABL886_04495 [Rhodoglobus sp.]
MTPSLQTLPESNRRAPRAVALANGWARLYTAKVGAEAGERRRGEIESDLWEQLADAIESETTAGGAAASITWRVIAGMPADLSWAHHQRALARGGSNREKGFTMSSLIRVVGRWWWVALALGICAWYAVIAAGNLAEPGTPYLEGAILAYALMGLVVAGTFVRLKWPVAGGILVVGGVGPSILLWWAPVFVVLAALVIAGAAMELIILPAAQRQLSAARAAGRTLAFLAAFVATTVPLATGIVPGVGVTALLAAALVVTAVVRRHQMRPATPASAV